MRFIPQPGILTYRSRGKESAVTLPVPGLMEIIIMISVRNPPPGRASDPNTIIRTWLLGRLPKSPGDKAVGIAVGVLVGGITGVAVAVGRLVGRGVDVTG